MLFQQTQNQYVGLNNVNGQVLINKSILKSLLDRNKAKYEKL